MSLAVRDTPYQREHYASLGRGMERGKMPRTLPGLMRWYIVALAQELPERLHKAEPWHDMVSAAERDAGLRPVGGSHLGAPAYAGGFRLIIEASSSVTDEDGYYLYPVRAALGRLSRRRPFMARFLFRVGQCEGDWQAVADALGYPDEMVETYTHAALVLLWQQTYDRTTKGMT